LKNFRVAQYLICFRRREFANSNEERGLQPKEIEKHVSLLEGSELNELNIKNHNFYQLGFVVIIALFSKLIKVCERMFVHS